MTLTPWHQSIRTLIVGGIGAALAALAGLPAAPLIGAALATAVVSVGGQSLGIDNRLRDAGFLIIGLSLGSGVEPSFFSQLTDWVFSLLILCVSVVVTLRANQWLLARVFGKDRHTALLASAPGTMSMAIALAIEGKGDAASVLVVQSMRLLCLAAMLPLLFFATGTTPETPIVYERFGLIELGVLALLTISLARLMRRLALPAVFMISGLVVSAIAHASGVVSGLPPQAVMAAGFCLTGSNIGSRFSGLPKRDIFRLFWASLATVGLAGAVSAVFAWGVVQLTGLPLAQVWLAFAPGGVEAMAAIGLAMGFDPAYVAVHHVVRIFLLMAVLSLWQHRSA